MTDQPVTDDSLASARPIAPAELLERISASEPNDPSATAPTLSDLLEDLADGWDAYGEAMSTAAALLRRHQPRLTRHAAAFDAAAAGLARAGAAARALGPDLRGFLPPLPWLGGDDPIPPARHDDVPRDPDDAPAAMDQRTGDATEAAAGEQHGAVPHRRPGSDADDPSATEPDRPS